VNLLQSTLDHQSAVVNFEAVQQAPPAPSSNRGLQDAQVILVPTPSPHGIFRAGAGQ
jgi:hypothetical protein